MDLDLRKLDLLHAVRSVEGVEDYANSMNENFSIWHTLQRVRLRREGLLRNEMLSSYLYSFKKGLVTHRNSSNNLHCYHC